MKNKAVLIGVEVYGDLYFTYTMEELENLAIACEYEVVGCFIQKLDRIQPTTYVGSGKWEEVNAYIEDNAVDAIICNDELTPSQIRNLETLLPCDVVDRTMLILDIFASRAKSKEAILQVEISRLKYQLPRLIGMYDDLGRQGGGSFTNRGGGEKKLELGRRRIEEQIHRKTKELKHMVQERQVQRAKRKRNGLRTVALVGYTNAGKSTLMNALVDEVDKQVFVKDMLFATLETRAKTMRIFHKHTCILIDTVGFVDKLPHHLVQAFRSTLEEVLEADLLLHVIDLKHPHYREQMDITVQTLRELGASEVPMIEVYNKIDGLEVPPYKQNDKVYISAKHKFGLPLLKEVIETKLYGDYVKSKLCIPYEDFSSIAYMNKNAIVLHQSNQDDGILMDVLLRKHDVNKYHKFKV